jgi:ATP-dependent exoDNAse (exonuclease V) beta subunit
MRTRVDAADEAWKPSAGSLLHVLWPAASTDFEFIESDAEMPLQLETPHGGPIHRMPAGFSPLGDALEWPDATDPEREETPIFDWAVETARRVGSLVHAELQYMDLDQVSEASIAAREAQFRRWLALHGVPADRLAEASARVVAALIAVLGDARGRWILAKGYQDDVREHALSGQWRGAVTRVVFDRSFIDPAGVRWIIDYKTSHHGGGGLEEFLDREVERYRAQLARYAEMARMLGPQPVRVALYFPLMRAWREWQS